MTMMKLLLEALEDIGYLVFDSNEDDYDLREYITDSLDFLNYIIKLEEKIGIELPAEFLSYDTISSAAGLSAKLTAYLEEAGIVLPDCRNNENEKSEQILLGSI